MSDTIEFLTIFGISIYIWALLRNFAKEYHTPYDTEFAFWHGTQTEIWCQIEKIIHIYSFPTNNKKRQGRLLKHIIWYFAINNFIKISKQIK